MRAPNALTSFNLMVDGMGYGGQVEEMVLPDYEAQEEDVRAGGYLADRAVVVGMQKMVCSFVLMDFSMNILKTMGFMSNNRVNLVFAGAFTENGISVPVELKMSGPIRKVTGGDAKAGSVHRITVEQNVEVYKGSLAGVEQFHIAPYDGIIKIDGVNKISEIVSKIFLARSAIGQAIGAGI